MIDTHVTKTGAKKKTSWRGVVGCTECFTNFDKLNLAKLPYGGSVLGSRHFWLLPQLPQKMTHATKVVKSDSKIINLLRKFKSLTHSVVCKGEKGKPKTDLILLSLVCLSLSPPPPFVLFS